MMRVATLTVVFLLSACSWLATTSDTTVLKSPNDPREYRFLRLQNGLPVLLVRDSGAEKAAASLDVNVGSRHDPAGREGLAHFLEHMLFLGTENYPEPGEYQAFISAHGGSHNAFTAFEHTNYFFDIENAQLDAALDRFAEFFVVPLFNEQYVEREKNAVESEYRARVKDEARRIIDATQAVTNPAHPFSRFSIGSLDTLADKNEKYQRDVRDDMLDFYRRHYSASQMALTVIGDYSFVELEKMVAQRFSGIANNGQRPSKIAEPLLRRSQLLTVVPEKSLRQLRFTFPTPGLRAHFRSKPLQYIGNVIGHEGKGSLLSALKARGWAETLSAGAGLSYNDAATFQVNVSLTEAGVQHFIEVGELLFAAISKLSAEGVTRAQFDEQRQIADIAFRFYEKPSVTAAAIRLSGNLQAYPPQSVIAADYIYADYQPALIQAFLSHMHVDNVLVTLVAQDLPAALPARSVSPWFATRYGRYALEPAWQKRWRSPQGLDLITLPQPNPFVPDNLAVLEAEGADDSAAVPQRLIDERGFRLWYLQDTEFRVPKADVSIALQSRLPQRDARHAALAALYTRVVNDQLNEFLYPAYLAGAKFSFYAHQRGFSMKFGGYNASAMPLLQRALPVVAAPHIGKKRFNALRDELKRQLQVAQMATPYQRLDKITVQLMYKNFWNERDILAELDALSVADLQAFVASLADDAVIDMMVHGNVSKDDSQRLALLARQLPHCDCSFVNRNHVDVFRFAERKRYLHSVDLQHADASVNWYFPMVDDSKEQVAMAMLSAAILHPLFFNELRTEQQLGYVAGASYFPMHRWPGVRLQLQSPHASSAALADAMEGFLQSLAAKDIGEQAFLRHRTALAAELREKDQTLAQRSRRLWYDLALGELGFDYNQQIAASLESVSYQQWLAQSPLLASPAAASLLVVTEPFVGAANSGALQRWPAADAAFQSYP